MSKIIKIIFVLSILFSFSLGVVSSQSINETVNAVLARDISFNLDGSSHEFTDSDGKTLYPLIYQGSSFLPVRAVSEAAGLEVDWDGNTRTIILNSGEQDLDDTPYKDSQDYDPGDRDVTFTILPPQWAENAPDMDAVEERRGEFGRDYEIYLVEFFDSEENSSYAQYLFTDLEYNTDNGFWIEIGDRDEIILGNSLNEDVRIPYLRSDGTRVTAIISAGNSNVISYATTQTAELRDMQGNVLWSY